ncbi:hypothetical protein Dda_7192 [Drechslerella dactyloides]|uniref:Uncharacterized protein n=1 Tax=Drechslerella dactyloides TaxID=74499 RepID=A0AAD6ITB6_DREDA|nr:hypothetical protein Dda_7192 [Drechslerella dactyloides]
MSADSTSTPSAPRQGHQSDEGNKSAYIRYLVLGRMQPVEAMEEVGREGCWLAVAPSSLPHTHFDRYRSITTSPHSSTPSSSTVIITPTSSPAATASMLGFRRPYSTVSGFVFPPKIGAAASPTLK